MTLWKHASAYKTNEDIYNIFCKLVRSGYGLALVYTHLAFWGPNRKKKCLWFCGDPSTGKTDYLKALSSIFSTEDVSYVGNNVMAAGTPSKPKVKVQAIICNEINIKKAFGQDNIANIKTMFEGIGAQTRSNLYGLYRKQYAGCINFVSSNMLPGKVESESATEYRQNVWHPLLTRCWFVFTFTIEDWKERHRPPTHGDVSRALLFLV